MVKLFDKNNTLMEYQKIDRGSILKKGKRTIIFSHTSVNAGKMAQSLISKNSFNKLYNNGKKHSLIRNTSFYSLNKK